MKQPLNLLGKISKTHGYNGILVLISDQPLDDELEDIKEIFVVIDGLQVPFPVEEWTLQTNTSAYLRLEFVENRNDASGLVGCDVYADVMRHEWGMETGLEQWLGFAVHDLVQGNIGVIRQIENYNGNLVLQIMNEDQEILISLYPELICEINHDAKILQITTPEGYFD